MTVQILLLLFTSVGLVSAQPILISPPDKAIVDRKAPIEFHWQHKDKPSRANYILRLYPSKYLRSQRIPPSQLFTIEVTGTRYVWTPSTTTMFQYENTLCWDIGLVGEAKSGRSAPRTFIYSSPALHDMELVDVSTEATKPIGEDLCDTIYSYITEFQNALQQTKDSIGVYRRDLSQTTRKSDSLRSLRNRIDSLRKRTNVVLTSDSLQQISDQLRDSIYRMEDRSQMMAYRSERLIIQEVTLTRSVNYYTQLCNSLRREQELTVKVTTEKVNEGIKCIELMREKQMKAQQQADSFRTSRRSSKVIESLLVQLQRQIEHLDQAIASTTSQLAEARHTLGNGDATRLRSLDVCWWLKSYSSVLEVALFNLNSEFKQLESTEEQFRVAAKEHQRKSEEVRLRREREEAEEKR